MTRKKSKTKRVAPKPPKQRIVKRKTRQITLPQEVIELAEMTHFSIPRKIDLNKAPPPTIYVTPTELYIEDEQASEKKDILITWANVISKPESDADVYLTYSSESILKSWNFFEQNNARKLGESLGFHGTREIGFENKWEINRAILANFALHAKEPLAIASDVFVSLEINPITWQRDKRPKHKEMLLGGIAALAAVLAIFIFYQIGIFENENGYVMVGIMLLLILFVVAPIVLLGINLSAKLFPEFYGDSIVFVAPKATQLNRALSK